MRELTLKPAMQARKNRLRPSSVDSQPESGSTMALVTRYEVRTQVDSS